MKGKKTGGRVAGVPNKVTGDLKAMILGALEDVGGQQYLARQALENPAPFMTLLGKVLPNMQPEGGITNISLHLIAAQLVSAQMIEQQQHPTIVSTVHTDVDTQSRNLLDAPLPTE